MTDSNVAPLYLEESETILSIAAGRWVSVFIFPAGGERTRTWETVKKLQGTPDTGAFDRKDILVAWRRRRRFPVVCGMPPTRGIGLSSDSHHPVIPGVDSISKDSDFWTLKNMVVHSICRFYTPI